MGNRGRRGAGGWALEERTSSEPPVAARPSPLQILQKCFVTTVPQVMAVDSMMLEGLVNLCDWGMVATFPLPRHACSENPVPRAVPSITLKEG